MAPVRLHSYMAGLSLLMCFQRLFSTTKFIKGLPRGLPLDLHIFPLVNPKLLADEAGVRTATPFHRDCGFRRMNPRRSTLDNHSFLLGVLCPDTFFVLRFDRVSLTSSHEDNNSFRKWNLNAFNRSPHPGVPILVRHSCRPGGLNFTLKFDVWRHPDTRYNGPIIVDLRVPVVGYVAPNLNQYYVVILRSSSR